jgi:L,D-peptidoglycan transpeptidase YkuD (ErfK/YbiS/YcfS/YnhG family)
MIGRHLAHSLIFLVALIATALHEPIASAANDTACPSLLGNATRLFVGVAPSMSSSTGYARLFLRNSVNDQWQSSGTRMPVTFGRNGLGWSFDQTGTAGKVGGPVKTEGDGRTPAGVFAAGNPFGFVDKALQDYIRISVGTVCVDDLASPIYNDVVTLKTVPKNVSHENMWEIPLYRAGLIIRNPTNRAMRSGSCIFLHIWRAPDRATAGCIATSEDNVKRTQDFFDGERSVVAVFPQSSLRILSRCGLPE